MRSVSLLPFALALAACAEVAPADGTTAAMVAPLAAAPLVLSSTHAVRGYDVTFTMAGAQAGQWVYLIYGANLAPGAYCPSATAPLCMDLASPVYMGRRRANAQGVATFTVTVPATAPGTAVFQAATLGNPVVSNALEVTVLGAFSDTDGDGLSAGDEVGLHGTNPHVADSDNGGTNDGDEIALGTNPNDPADDGGTAPSGLTGPDVVLARPNLDDDNGNGNADRNEARTADDEFGAFQVVPSPNGAAAGLSTFRVTLDGDLSNLRILEGTTTRLGGTTTTVTLPWSAAPIHLSVEAKDLRAEGQLTIEERYANGQVASTLVIDLIGAPMILNHHLQPAEEVWGVSVNQWWGSNSAMMAGFANALGSAWTAVPGGWYGNDVWIQDEVELATLTSPSGRTDVVIDSIRDRGLDDFAEDYLRGTDFAVGVWGSGTAMSEDSFGNLEVSPPVEVNGVSYPFGRIYHGSVTNQRTGLHPTLRAALDDQAVQAPFLIDTTWLCVGHADEFQSFVPDPTSPKGFKWIVGDIDEGYALLDSLPSSMQIPQYAGSNSHGYSTIGAIVNDSGLRAYNEDIRDLRLNPLIQQFKDELGLTEADIVRIPALFEQVSGCGGAAAALIPGTANLVVADVGGGTTHVFMPDPFLRTNVSNPSTDPLIAAVDALMPPGITTHYVDDWDVYHMALGEVHCGTNVKRTPQGSWWTDAAHLIGRP